MDLHDRRDDWRHGVDENLASLNAGQRVWERELAAFRKTIAEVDALLRGDTEKETDGIIARLHAVENSIQLLKAILLKDAAGSKGLVGRVQDLEGKREDRRGLWKNLTSIIVAAIMSGLLTHFWSDIRAWATHKPTDPLDQMIDHAKHPRGRPILRYRTRRARPEEPADPDPETEE